MAGLPADSATWRAEHDWTGGDELAALQIEHADMWFRNLALLLRAKPSSLPKPVRIPRPGEETPARKRVENDPRVISAWFTKHVRG